jgi:hypothetical protein
MQNLTVTRQLARHHEMRLRRLAGGKAPDRRRDVRRWIGRTLIRTGFRLLGETPMRTAPAAH